MIKILSHVNALREVLSNSKKYNVIYITNPGDPYYKPEMYDLVDHAKEALVCQFLDREFKNAKYGQGGPTESDVQRILDFAKDKDNIICSCHAGRSRSSAVAFAIRCCTEDPAEALKILDMKYHDPNILIIEHASVILNNNKILTVIKNYKEQRLILELNSRG